MLRAMLKLVRATTVLALGCALVMTACNKDSGGSGSGSGSSDDTEGNKGDVASYEVRGKVIELPTAESRTIQIHHEKIEGFRSQEGKVVGMASMQMPFGVQEKLDLSGIAPGDLVTFRLEMHWGQKPPTRVTAIEKLPADTELELGDHSHH